jgi:ribosome maturation factor RimP
MGLSSGGRKARRFLFGSNVRAKTTEDRKIIELLDPVAEALGLNIVRLRVTGGQRRRLQIMAERPSDHEIAIEECTKLSRAVSEVLDAADPIPGEYMLEVSSPGIDRPLTRFEDFTTFEGLEARVELDRLVENRKRFKGTLAGVDGDNVAIDLEDEDETALVPFAWISDAKLVLTDALMKRGAEERAARLATEIDSLDSQEEDDA